MELRAGYKQTEVGAIPEDWDVTPLHQIAEKIMVGIASAATHAYRKKGVVMFRNQNIKPGYLDDSDVLYISESYEQTFKNKRLKAGDLLTARTGYPGTTSIVSDKYEGAQSFTTLITRPRVSAVDPEYLCYFVNSEVGQLYFELNQIGGGQKNVNAGTLKLLPVPIPPSTSEQRAIATALSDADALLAKIDQLIAKKRDLKQATMQQLLTGQTRLPEFSGEWEMKRLGDLILEISDGGTPSTANRSNFGGAHSWVVIDDICDEIRSTKETLSDEGLRACSARLWPIGALILSTGATIGEVGIAKVPVATKQGICGLLFSLSSANPIFMKYWFQQNKQLLLSKAQGSSIKEVRAPTLIQFLVCTPDVAEQAAIANALSDMDAELLALEARRNKTRALKQGMMQTLLSGRIRLVGANQ